MRFTGPRGRDNYASMVVFGIKSPPWVFDLGEILAARMSDMTEGRMWMGAHMRRGDTYDLDGVKPDLDQSTLDIPLPDDPFYVATDERDPTSRQVIADGGAIFISDLLTMDDRRRYGWPLMITDVLALVEQRLLVHSAFFYGHAMSSLAGVISNMRAARGADPRTMLID